MKGSSSSHAFPLRLVACSVPSKIFYKKSFLLLHPTPAFCAIFIAPIPEFLREKLLPMNQTTDMSDEKLIQFYLNGNPNAMATLVELYKDRIYGSIYTTVQDRHAAEEIFHDVFIQIINKMMAGQTPEQLGFLQWAIKLAHALCLEHARNTQMAIYADRANAEAKDHPLAVLPPSAMYHESHGKIKSMIDMLPQDQREVLMLNHYAGLSLKDISDIMKCSLTVALDNLKFGLNNLRKMMMEKEIVLQ